MFAFCSFLDSEKILTAPCKTLGHVFSKESVTESGAQQAKRLTPSRPRDFISASTKQSDCNKGGNDETFPAPVENSSRFQSHQAPTVMQTKNSSSGRASTDPHKAQPDSQRQLTANVTLNGIVDDFLDNGSASPGERNDAVNQNRSVLLDSEELEGKDEYVLMCFCMCHSITELLLTTVKYLNVV